MSQKTITIGVKLLIISIYVSAQTAKMEPELEKYFKAAEKKESYYIAGNLLKTFDTKKTIKIAKPYLGSEIAFVRYRALDLIKRKGLTLEKEGERPEIVHLIIAACKDKDSGNSGAASMALGQFNKGDFDPAARDSVFGLLKAKIFHYEQVIKLAGFLEIDKAQEFLKTSLLKDSTLNKKDRWAMHLALARMGDPGSLAYCMDKAKTLKVNDNAVDYVFPGLVYTRQTAAFEFMLHVILSDEKKCSSPNPDSEADIICAFKIMELVAPYIKEFPLPLTSGELDIENYDEALAITRKWINENKTFSIDKETF